ncbi:recombination protein RecT [Bacillus haynesii]|uniref:recombination protein RecT n=1 Tax=Bacillus TaxID=1386 RepID=UPI0002DC3200|nr:MULTISPECIES: recombination protein RecT [Bacillus]KJH55767.1 recombinase RecT [Bacillus licheniformis]MCY7774913.1 recombination protein RecT [Bacillus licheniformis]MCY8242650.1 recombination protein RecT [Bacillus haynesii]MCY8354583.1 recombination protein RecT [Bacillus haynesii]MCY8540088.1 recombination protein RecT [Bacillus haynesii]
MAKNADIRNQLANKVNSVQTQSEEEPKTIAGYLKKLQPELQKALPKHITPERITRIVLTTIRNNPALQECSPGSLLGAVMQSAQLGLEPGLVGHCYFVPFWNNKEKRREVQFIIGYKGMIDLARRSGHIQSIYAYTVHEADKFVYELGLHPKLIHKPATGQRGEMTHVYAVAHFKEGGYQFEVLTKHDVENVRNRSKSKDNGPWITDYEEMAKKTVVRRLWKYLPISIEIQQQVAQDETVRKDITAEAQSVYDDELVHVSSDVPVINAPEPQQTQEENQEAKPSVQDDADPFNGEPINIKQDEFPFDD